MIATHQIQAKVFPSRIALAKFGSDYSSISKANPE